MIEIAPARMRAGPGMKALPCVGLMDLDVTLHAFFHQLVLIVGAITLLALVDRYLVYRKSRARGR
jgi:hypothetical protein